jgi:hypothetical protein
MSETMGRLLAAGQRAEVFEWGSRAVKLDRCAAKQTAFREAAIHAAMEVLGLPVPAIWGVQKVSGRWGIVFDRVSGLTGSAGVYTEKGQFSFGLTPERVSGGMHRSAPGVTERNS